VRWFLTGDGRLAFCFTAPASGVTCDEAPLTTTDRLDRDRWTLVAVVRTGASVRMLLDGRPSASGTVDARFVPANPPFLEAELRLGAGPGGTAPFVGLIDEVLLLRTTLTPADVADVMRATTIGVK
jgi:hypothetical protein